MGKDSKKTLELVGLNNFIYKPLVDKHNGKWLKKMGDGTLASFNTASKVLSCAIEITSNKMLKIQILTPNLFLL